MIKILMLIFVLGAQQNALAAIDPTPTPAPAPLSAPGAVQGSSSAAEEIVKVSEATLKDIDRNSDFLTTLWKYTIVIAGILTLVFGFLGVKSILDLNKASIDARDATRESTVLRAKMREDFAKLSAETSANFTKLSIQSTQNLVMIMQCFNADRLANEVESERPPDDAPEEQRREFEMAAAPKCKTVQDTILKAFQENTPEEPTVVSFAYNLLSWAQYNLGNVSAALASVKKSLEYREGNASAHYNAACCAGQLHLIDLCVGHLQRAIELDQSYRTAAKTDHDFDPVRDAPTIRALLGA